jgi:hypothetical protein
MRRHTLIILGCHDNGYVTNLRSQITAGFKQKLILLPTYTEIAAGIAELELPVLTIPELFLTEKLSTPPSDLSVPPGLGPSSPSIRARMIQTTTQNDEKLATRSWLVDGPDTLGHQPPSSYSSAVNTGQKRAPMPDVDSTSSHETDNSDEGLNYYSTTFNGTKRINPNIVSRM